MKAISLIRTKEVWDDGTVVELVVWQLPEPLPPSTHHYKYRLYFGNGDVDFVRYDNERGKGDHRHVQGAEETYTFDSVEQLLIDFERDMREWGKT